MGSGVCCSVWEAIHQIDEIEIRIVFRSHRDGNVGLVILGTMSQDVAWKRRDEQAILLGAKRVCFYEYRYPTVTYPTAGTA